MKLVLKFNELIKLYTGQMKYSRIIQFLTTEIKLKKESIQITYTDSDGDEIYLGDDNDIQVLTSLTDNKSYIKINVKGQEDTQNLKENTIFDQQSQKTTNSLDYSIQKTKQQEKIKVKQMVVNSVAPNEIMDEKPKKKKAKSKAKQKTEKSEQKQQKIKKQVKKQKKQQKKQQADIIQLDQIKKFSKLMTQTITAIVDERVQTLVSSVRKQTQQNLKKVHEKKKQIVHKGFTCKSCSVSPIIGIRYECPKCIDFSICQDCEQSYEHGHNMLKIKRIKQLEDQKDKIVNKNMKKIYNLIVHDKKKKEKQSKPEIDDKNMKNCKQLKMIFGGQPKDYKLFVEKYSNIQFNHLLQVYCQENNIEVKEGKEKYIQMLCTRLTKLNKLQPNQLKKFVKDNPKLNYEGLVKLCNKEQKAKIQETRKLKKEHVIQKQQKPNLISQDQNLIQNSKSELRKSVSLSKSLVKSQKEQQAQVQFKVIEANKKIQPIVEVNKEANKDQRQKLEKNQIPEKELQIYNLMVQIFGEQRAREYPAFIEKYLKDGKQNIIMLWSNNMSVIEP